MNPLRERFDSNIRAKATIGHPFTLDDVAASLQVPVTDLPSSWMTSHVNTDIVRVVGTAPSKNPKSNGRRINMYSGTYYLELEAQEERERALPGWSVNHCVHCGSYGSNDKWEFDTCNPGQSHAFSEAA